MKPGWLPGSRSIFIAIERNMEMERIKPRTLSGFMELLPAPQMQMERMMETLRRTYSLYGFTPLDTPVIESAEVLLAKGGGETEKQIYRFTKGDADLALRFDLTVPLPALSDWEGLPGRTGAARAVPGILPGGY